MKNQSNKRENVSRPKDESLQAYKFWIIEIAKRLTKEDTQIEFSEEEWIANWKEYWKEKVQK